MRDDYYQLLEVEPGASAQEIKAAYYRMARRCHPDHNAGKPEAEERFKLVAEAYRTLGIPERRREYDNWLHLHNKYHRAPELESLAARRVRPFRYSSRHARERAERPRSRRRVGNLVFHGSSRLNNWLFIGFYALVIVNILPIFFRHMFAEPPVSTKKALPAAQKEEPSEVNVRRRLLEMEGTLRQRAQAGEPEAQYQLGLYLFNKSARGRAEGDSPSLLRRAASAGYREEALLWLRRAEEQGHAAAGRLLRRLVPSL